MRQLLTLLVILLIATGVMLPTIDYARPAIDVRTIDRVIRKEPEYKSKDPRYGLLLFGRDASVRVWVVLDGDVIYLDRNGDGDLTDPNERFAMVTYSDDFAFVRDCKNIEIADPAHSTSYAITHIAVSKTGNPPVPHLRITVDIKGPVAYQESGSLFLQHTPSTASMAHFDGQLTIGQIRTLYWKMPPNSPLTIGAKSTRLEVIVGTIDPDHGSCVAIRSCDRDRPIFPKGMWPVADIEFPAKVPGGPSVKKRYALDKFC